MMITDQTPQLRPGSERCQCGECHQFFSTTRNFDKHRVGPYDGVRRCLTAAEMVSKKGLVLVNGVWQRPPSPGFSRATQEVLLEGDA
jgi:hypothetical protein